MSEIKITSRMRSFNPDFEEGYTRYYDGNGVLHETMGRANECDYACESYHRTSKDKGKTWTEWETVYKDTAEARRGALAESPDGDELLGGHASPYLYDPVSGCSFGISTSGYYLKGHNVGYFDMWRKGEDNIRWHAYYAIKYPDGRIVNKMFEFEEGGADYDPKKYRDPAFLDKNRCLAENLRILPDGDLCFNLFPTVRLCCKIAGVDVNGFFPSCPDLHTGMIVVRVHWNAEKGDYDFIYSNPIMLSDLQSSRCIMEPHMTVLPDGRWLLVVRGSNSRIDVWNTRIGKTTPGYKWYTISADGGKTFAPLMPWHFDTKEVVYSSASIHSFYRSPKNNKLYWIGNVIEDPALVRGNNPRFPLHICQVDEEEGCLIKDTLTVIDTIRGDQTSVELSNFNLLTDPDTGDLEMRMTKINFNGQYQEQGYWYSEAWEYYIDFSKE